MPYSKCISGLMGMPTCLTRNKFIRCLWTRGGIEVENEVKTMSLKIKLLKQIDRRARRRRNRVCL